MQFLTLITDQLGNLMVKCNQWNLINYFCVRILVAHPTPGQRRSKSPPKNKSVDVIKLMQLTWLFQCYFVPRAVCFSWKDHFTHQWIEKKVKQSEKLLHLIVSGSNLFSWLIGPLISLTINAQIHRVQTWNSQPPRWPNGSLVTIRIGLLKYFITGKRLGSPQICLFKFACVDLWK